jgi:oligoribonuclease
MSEINKHAAATKFLWVDLEMTGLNVQQDVILEVAALVTDVQFNVIASYEACIHHSDEILNAMNDWSQQQHGLSGLTERCRTEGKPESEVIGELATFIKTEFGVEPAILSGNSIHNDRNFIKQWWPEVEAVLHYRMLDVSSWKVVMQAQFGSEFPKAENHRALDDINASIEELKYYLEQLKDGPSDS